MPKAISPKGSETAPRGAATSVRLRPRTRKRIKLIAVQEEITQTAVIELAVEELAKKLLGRDSGLDT